MVSILFLHGGSLNKEMWIPQIVALSSDFDVHAIDLPGHGENIDEPFSLELAIDAIDEYITNTIEREVIVVGLSLGGYVAIAYTYKHPEKVSKLIVSGCCIQYFGYLGFLSKMFSTISYFISENLFRKIQTKLLIKLTSREILDSICANGFSLKGGIESSRELIGKDFVYMMSKISIPTLLINGENDKLNKKYEDLYISVGINLSISTIKNCAHLCSLEGAGIYSALISNFSVTE